MQLSVLVCLCVCLWGKGHCAPWCNDNNEGFLCNPYERWHMNHTSMWVIYWTRQKNASLLIATEWISTKSVSACSRVKVKGDEEEEVKMQAIFSERRWVRRQMTCEWVRRKKFHGHICRLYFCCMCNSPSSSRSLSLSRYATTCHSGHKRCVNIHAEQTEPHTYTRHSALSHTHTEKHMLCPQSPPVNDQVFYLSPFVHAAHFLLDLCFTMPRVACEWTQANIQVKQEAGWGECEWVS